MTSTPTTISLADLSAAGAPFFTSLAAKMKALHTFADTSGDAALQALVDDMHTGEGGLTDAQNAFIGLFPAQSADRPQPQEGGGNKPPAN